MSDSEVMNYRVKMRELALSRRTVSFDEVARGYNENEALREAARCLRCKHAPCVSGCPVKIDIPAFIKEINHGNTREAYKIITEANLLPAICGRVCPQEVQCEAKCVRGIKGEPLAIGHLERFVCDNYYQEPENILPTKGRVAVIGSGPAGLTCSGMLSRFGYEVHVYEALHELGGVLVYGIPEFRLPKRVVSAEIDKLRKMGVIFYINTVVGKTITLEELLSTFNAVFIGTGAGLPKFMGIPGENLNGVLSANEFLTRINLMKANQKGYDTPLKALREVIVVGGGNVAMDAARAAHRLGAQVTVLYRRSFEEMPARREEVHHALEEGIKILFLVNPVTLTGEDYFVKRVNCVQMKLSAPDESGRRRTYPIDGTEFTLPADTVIMALGNYPNPLLAAATPDLLMTSGGCIVINDRLMTSKKGVFAGGDAVTGAATVIMAMAAGKAAAYEIDNYITKT